MVSVRSSSKSPATPSTHEPTERDPFHFYVVSYDIPNDRRRAKTAKILEDFGERVQYSVFFCRLRTKDFQRLQQRLKKVHLAEEDDVRFFTLCESCQRRAQVWSKRKPQAVWKKSSVVV